MAWVARRPSLRRSRRHQRSHQARPRSSGRMPAKASPCVGGGRVPAGRRGHGQARPSPAIATQWRASGSASSPRRRRKVLHLGQLDGVGRRLHQGSATSGKRSATGRCPPPGPGAASRPAEDRRQLQVAAARAPASGRSRCGGHQVRLVRGVDVLAEVAVPHEVLRPGGVEVAHELGLCRRPGRSPRSGSRPRGPRSVPACAAQVAEGSSVRRPMTPKAPPCRPAPRPAAGRRPDPRRPPAGSGGHAGCAAGARPAAWRRRQVVSGQRCDVDPLRHGVRRRPGCRSPRRRAGRGGAPSAAACARSQGRSTPARPAGWRCASPSRTTACHGRRPR